MADRRHRRGGRYTAPKREQAPPGATPEGYVIVDGPDGPELVYAPELRQAMRDSCPECQEGDGHASHGPRKPSGSGRAEPVLASEDWEPSGCEVCGEEVPMTPTDGWTAYHRAVIDGRVTPMWLCPRHGMSADEEVGLLYGETPERFRR